jgi:LPXTG-motif cell wall-anchored protein
MRWWSFWNSVIGLLLLVIGAALLFWRHRPR